VSDCRVDPSFESARFLNAKSAKVIHRKGRKVHLNFQVGVADREAFARGDGPNSDTPAMVGSGRQPGAIRVISKTEDSSANSMMRCFVMVFAILAFFAFQRGPCVTERGCGTRDHRRPRATSAFPRPCRGR
jgi:hypothetical protein